MFSVVTRHFHDKDSMSSKKSKAFPLPQLGSGSFAVDSHCHLDMTDYDDCPAVVARAHAVGVRYILSVGIDLPSSKAALALASEHPGVYATVGIHPHHVAEARESDYRELVELAKHPKVKAYGEIGLDYVRNYASKEVQISHYRRQVALAKELALPLIIHDREAHADVMEVLTEASPFPAGGVMHCYSGDRELAKAVMSLGFFLSIPGVVTFAKADILQSVAREIPLESLLVETDAPYLAPVPYRGKRNEPAYVLHTIAKIAALRGIAPDEVARQTTANAVTLFKLEAEL